MGLIKAAFGSAGGVLADEWRDFFYCEALDADTLMAKGVKRVTDRSSNTKGEPNIITNGSVIAVADGQCMIIVENGAIVEVCAEPGQFTYDKSTQPSIFYGGLGKGIVDSFKQMGERFGFGGNPGVDQRIYYFNTKEIIGNKYGTAAPVPFRVVDTNIGLDIDIAVRCNGVYSYKLTDPLKFYKNVAGNVEDEYDRSEIDSQLKSELLTALQPAFARISAMGIRYSAVPAHTTEMADALNEELSSKWRDLRGIEIASFGMNSITASEEDENRIKDLQASAALRDPSMRQAYGTMAQGEAMKTAAGNEAGAMAGFMGMGMANAMGGANAQALYGQTPGGYEQPQNNYAVAQGGGYAAQPAADGWVCSCGAANTGNFCSNCGSPKPAPAGVWKCSCGNENTGNFCSNCGSAKPAESATWTCSCGAENEGNFCSTCGSKRP